MINVSKAICTATATTLDMYVQVPGFWDADNQWVPNGYTTAIPISMTPMPVGDNQTGTHGQSLKTDNYGERYPAMMRFHARVELPLNAVIVHNNIPYKLTRRSDHNHSGFWAGIGFTHEKFNPDDYPQEVLATIVDGVFQFGDGDGATPVIDDESILRNMTLKMGGRDVTLWALLARRRR